MTLNMRYDNPEDGANNWRFRRERIAELIRSEAVDLLGTQEVLANQFDDLQALLPGYRAVGVGREDGARFRRVLAERESRNARFEGLGRSLRAAGDMDRAAR